MSAAHETSSELAIELPRKIVPKHGRGALLAGGIKGHRGAGGRPPSKVVKISQKGYLENFPVLCQIAKDETASRFERIAAIREIGRYAGPEKVEGGLKIESHGKTEITIIDV